MRALFERMEALGLHPNPKGYQNLGLRARTAIWNATVDLAEQAREGWSTRAHLEAILAADGEAGIRKLLTKAVSPNVQTSVIEWLRQPAPSC